MFDLLRVEDEQGTIANHGNVRRNIAYESRSCVRSFDISDRFDWQCYMITDYLVNIYR